jgi:hypothetical protein
MAQINTATINAPGPNPRRICEGNTNSNGAPRTEFNGVDIRNPFRTFADREKFLLGERGAAVVEELKEARRKTMGAVAAVAVPVVVVAVAMAVVMVDMVGEAVVIVTTVTIPIIPIMIGANTNNGGGNRNVKEASTGGRAGQNDQPQQSSNSSSISLNAQSQASTSDEHGGQNGARFGNNRPKG